MLFFLCGFRSSFFHQLFIHHRLFFYFFVRLFCLFFFAIFLSIFFFSLVFSPVSLPTLFAVPFISLLAFSYSRRIRDEEDVKINYLSGRAFGPLSVCLLTCLLRNYSHCDLLIILESLLHWCLIGSGTHA